MSAAMIPLAIQALTELIPIVQNLIQQAQSGQVPTEEQIAAAEAAVDQANAAIQAS